MKFYQVDSFTDVLFRGNPAGVCLLGERRLSEETMKNIAMENNLSETAFVTEENGMREIRWFTPAAEVVLCGHATLAAAHVLFNHENAQEKEIVFNSKSGVLKVARDGDCLTLDFPMRKIEPIAMRDELDCFNHKPDRAFRGDGEYLLVFANEDQIRTAVCDLKKAAVIDLCGFIITAKAENGSRQNESLDFVSRYFSPKYGLDEDPVTGSAHTLLVPYWRSVLNKDHFQAAQLSKRGGRLSCTAEGARVKISGKAVTYLAGEIFV